MDAITESKIETFAIELLQQQGYEYLSGVEIAPDSKNSLRLKMLAVQAKYKKRGVIYG